MYIHMYSYTNKMATMLIMIIMITTVTPARAGGHGGRDAGILREMEGAPRKPAPRSHLWGVDCQTVRPPLHRGALDKQSCH